jgi:DNA topoisomerase-6 subunit B
MAGEDIFRQFKEHSVAEFFKKNRQMLGFSGKVRSMTMIVHEFVTNSLDACEEAGILPEIHVRIEEMGKDAGPGAALGSDNAPAEDHYRLTIRDNGPGIPKSHLGKALGQMLAGTKFHRYIQQRGQQGIGASACVMYSYLTTGQPTKAISICKGKKYTANISMDFKSNKPIVEELGEEDALEGESGLTVIAQFKDVRYEKSNYGVCEYLRRTALANPHCSITLIGPDGEQMVFPRSVAANPPRPFEIKPHPLGVATHDLLELAKHNSGNRKISAFLQNEFSRVSAAKVEELRSLVPEVNFDKDPRSLEWHEAEKIVKAFGQVKWIAPAMDSLVPIGKGQVEASFRNIFNPDVLVVTERSPKVYRGGIPFMIEAGIAYGGGLVSAGKRGEAMRFSNRVPLLFDAGGCAITEAIKAIDWGRYDLKDFDEEPVAVLVNLVSVHVPYTGAGKQAISCEADVMEEIKLAIMEASRGVQKHISGKRKAHDIANKKKVIGRYTQQLAGDLAALSGQKKDRIEQQLVKIIEEKYSGPGGELDDSGPGGGGPRSEENGGRKGKEGQKEGGKGGDKDEDKGEAEGED